MTVKIRGLPFTASPAEILSFFEVRRSGTLKSGTLQSGTLHTS